MKILAIESSCDETSAAVVEQSPEHGSLNLLAQITATSLALHSKTGGIIPEVAARAQSTYIIPVIQETLKKANMVDGTDIDAIAVTYGPGLIGSLLVGVETAKTLAYLWQKPLFPINHLFGHTYANWLSERVPQFPLIALIVSGGHTDLLLMKAHTDITWLGGTRDDAAGECFDKTGRLLGFPYPAGPLIEEKAKIGDPKAYHFPRPLLHDGSLDFSFSGLKTAVLREVEKLRHSELDSEYLTEQQTNNLCRGVQDAILDVLIGKTMQAAEKYSIKSILLSGGVAANQTLREKFQEILDTKLFVPAKSLCTDNAAMIGAAAFFQGKEVPWQEVSANPELYFE